MAPKKPAKTMTGTEAKTGMGKGGMNPKMGTRSPGGEEALKKQGSSGGARGAAAARPATKTGTAKVASKAARPAASTKTKAPAKATKK